MPATGETVEPRSPEDTPTLTTPGGHPVEPPESGVAQRFLPGARFGSRYRIIERVGGGGMGEIYRADDLQLNQAVALKFLPAHLADDEAAVAHLRNEVRLARQVSHPNVCRVYDIGEVDGQYFLSMEYVDGEDLASIVRRLGRPATEKAVGFARQLCLGLAAAHANGVLHHDLKPANVMIDGRGRVRITDFGVAGLARERRAGGARGGTPVYMAPELLRGEASSARSDIYSLGLVLYEMFTGRPPYAAASFEELKRALLEDKPSRPGEYVTDLDPAAESVILGCLEKDPRDRPKSALAVAAAFPTGDALSEALEAGETPSPELVAEAGPAGGLRPSLGVACLAGLVAGLVLGLPLAERTTLHGLAPYDRPFAVLEERAREHVRNLGYPDPPVDSYSTLNFHRPAIQYFARQDRSADRWRPLTRPGQIGLNFLYRHSPGYLVPLNLEGRIGFEHPYPQEGNINVSTGLQGRLLRFAVTPPFVDHEAAFVGPMDWSPVFEAARLDIDEFEPIPPTVRPRAHSDAQAAWRGVLPHRGDLPVRVEATALAGRVVFFETVTPYDPFWSAETRRSMERPPTSVAAQLLSIGLVVLIAACAVGMAIRNLRLGRGDRRGALRVALLVLFLRMAHGLVGGPHVPDVGGEFSLFVNALGGALVLSVFTWVLYVALEPYFRRLWPRALVGWTRLLAGRFRDPLVGRDALMGMALGAGIHLLRRVTLLAPEGMGLPPRPPDFAALDALAGGRRAFGELFQVPLEALAVALGWALVFLLLRMVLQRQWIATAGFCLIFAALDGLAFAADPSGEILWQTTAVGAFGGLVLAAVIVVILVRFGLLAMVAAFLTSLLLTRLPLAADPSAPYFETTLLALGVVMVLAAVAFRNALEPRSRLRGELLSEP